MTTNDTTPPESAEEIADALGMRINGSRWHKVIDVESLSFDRPELVSHKQVGITLDFTERAEQLIQSVFTYGAHNELREYKQLVAAIASFAAKAATLSGDEREMRGREYQAERINAWLDNPNRQPANLAFTAGSERQIAYRVERLLAEAATAVLEQAAQNRPKIICLCGSTRFVQTWIDEYQRLSDEGNIVLTVARMPPRPNLQYDEPELKRKLDGLHFHKIALADEVFILNVGGYIGESTAREIEHAMNLKKTIRWLEQPIAAIGNDKGQQQ